MCQRGGKKPKKPKTHNQKVTQQSKDKVIKDARNPFRLKKENEAIKDRIIKDIKNLFELEENYYELVRVGNLYSHYIEYESNGGRNKILSAKLDEIKSYLKDIISNLKKSDL